MTDDERFWYVHLFNSDPTGAVRLVRVHLEWRQGYAGEAHCTAPGQYEVLLPYPHPERARLRLAEKGWIKWTD